MKNIKKKIKFKPSFLLYLIKYNFKTLFNIINIIKVSYSQKIFNKKLFTS